MCMATNSRFSFYVELCKACTSLHTSLWDAIKPTKTKRSRLLMPLKA